MIVPCSSRAWLLSDSSLWGNSCSFFPFIPLLTFLSSHQKYKKKKTSQRLQPIFAFDFAWSVNPTNSLNIRAPQQQQRQRAKPVLKLYMPHYKVKKYIKPLDMVWSLPVGIKYCIVIQVQESHKFDNLSQIALKGEVSIFIAI